MNVKKSNRRLVAFILQNNIYFLTLILLFVPMLFLPEFRSAASMTVLLKNISLWGIMAIGMTFVLLLGVFDMSIGMNVSMLTVVLVYACQGLGFGLGIISTIILGVFGGFINGIFITKLKINPFITTLGTMVVFKGIGLVICNGSPVLNTNQILANLFELKVFTLPIFTFTFPMLIMLICLGASIFILRFTKFGQDIYVVGGNIEAAKVAGINIDRIYIFCYMIVGLAAGITAILLTSFQSSGNAAFGETYALQSIAACVLGGIHMKGGFGNTVRAILGVASLQLIIKILYYVASQFASLQIGIVGIILIIVLILDMTSTRVSESQIKKS